MDFKTTLKWTFLLFCINFTSQVVFVIFVVEPFLIPYWDGDIYHYSQIEGRYIIELMVIALAGALPVLVFTQNKSSGAPGGGTIYHGYAWECTLC